MEKVVNKKVNHKVTAKIGYIFMLVSTILLALVIIPMCWCIPMTLHVKKVLKEEGHIGTGFKVCALIFVSLPGGILLLCDSENGQKKKS